MIGLSDWQDCRLCNPLPQVQPSTENTMQAHEHHSSNHYWQALYCSKGIWNLVLI